jgi:hypothetical protein
LTETKEIKESMENGNTAAVETWVKARDGETLPKPFKIRKRIGSTDYEVEVRFSPASRETLDEKILRLVRGEAMKKGSEP